MFKVSAKDPARGQDGILNKKNRRLVKYLQPLHCELFFTVSARKKKSDIYLRASGGAVG